MKIYLLFAVFLISTTTYAQLPEVIGKEKSIMKAYCDSLMTTLHFTKKSMGRDNDAVLMDKKQNRILLVNYKTDAADLVSEVGITGDSVLIQELIKTRLEGKKVVVKSLHKPGEKLPFPFSGNMVCMIINSNE